MNKRHSDLAITDTLGPRPELPKGRLPTLQERNETEGRKRPARPAPRKAADPNQTRTRFVQDDGHVLEPIKHDLGKPSPIFRAKRKASHRVGNQINPEELKRVMTAGARNPDLRSQGMPTLAERFQAEGMAAYGRKFAKKGTAKPGRKS